MNQEQIIKKVKDLLSLSKSNNVNESSAAFAAAQKLLSKHRLSIADVENTSDLVEELIKEDALYVGKRAITWKGQLANGIASVNSCAVVWHTGYGFAKLAIVGRESDIEIVQFLFGSVVSQIEDLCRAAAIVRNGGKKGGKTFANNFKIGAVGSVIQRLRATKKEVEQEYQGTKALVLVDKREQEVKDWMVNNFGKLKARHSSSRADYEGYKAGQEAGRRVNLTRGSIKASHPKGYLN